MSKFGLPSEIKAHFMAYDDDEQMSYEDACEKFGCNMQQLQNALTRVRQKGAIETVHVIRRAVKADWL